MGLFNLEDLRRRQFLARRPSVRWGRLLGTGLFFGILLGVAIGCLIAPASGRVTRSRVRRRVDDIKGNLRETASELESTGQDLLDEAEKQVRTVKKVVSKRFQKSDNEEDVKGTD